MMVIGESAKTAGDCLQCAQYDLADLESDSVFEHGPLVDQISWFRLPVFNILSLVMHVLQPAGRNSVQYITDGPCLCLRKPPDSFSARISSFPALSGFRNVHALTGLKTLIAANDHTLARRN